MLLLRWLLRSLSIHVKARGRCFAISTPLLDGRAAAIDGVVLVEPATASVGPGGAKAILLYAGKDATDEFDMLHKRDVITKYAPDAIIGTLA